MRISDWSSDVCSSDLISSNSAISSPLLSQPHCAFPPIMPVRTLFATNFYEADIGSPELLEELEESSRLFAEEDGAGRAWSREHGYKGYTSYASLGDLPERTEEHTSELQSLMRSSYAVLCL